MKPYYEDSAVTIYHGEALRVLADLEASICDALITDPPYSSGGMVRGDRTQRTRNKYHADKRYNDEADFSGDNRDQRSFAYWCSLWLDESRRIVKPQGVAGVFSDWRQLPSMTDAFQSGGWVWRGIVPWYKPTARPISGRFTANCEYFVWGSNGARSVDGWGFALPGFVQGNAPPSSVREHLTQKPVNVVSLLCKIAGASGCVLDPFMGSGTTLVAAKQNGQTAIGVEMIEANCEIAAKRCAAEMDFHTANNEVSGA